jgi:putative hemolysin
MDIFLILLAMVALLLMQGFFSGSEIALVHADRLKLHHLARQGNRGAKLVIKLFRKPEVLLGTTLVGTNLSLVILTTLGTIVMIRFFGEYGELVAFLVYTPLFLIFGEVVPKSVYQQKADSLAPVIIYPIQIISRLFYPIVSVFSWLARRIAHMVGVDITSGEIFTSREQVGTVIEMAEQGADIDVFDRDRIMRVIRFADTTVGQAMIPIAEMTLISHDKSTQDAIELARERGHFRLPVFDTQHSQITGVVSFTMWRLMDPDLRHTEFSQLIHPACYVAENQLLDDILPLLQQRSDHMAIVVDEFESAIGMVTLEDVLERVVGEVMNVGYTFENYLPRQKPDIEKLEEGSYIMDGRYTVQEVNNTFGIKLTTEASTIAGMVISKLRHLPTEGEYVDDQGYRFTVEEVSDRGIRKIRAERT